MLSSDYLLTSSIEIWIASEGLESVLREVFEDGGRFPEYIDDGFYLIDIAVDNHTVRSIYQYSLEFEDISEVYETDWDIENICTIDIFLSFLKHGAVMENQYVDSNKGLIGTVRVDHDTCQTLSKYKRK